MTTLRQRIGRRVIATLPVSQSTIALVRQEAAAIGTRWRYRWLPWWRWRAAGLRRMRDIWVNVASGPFPLDGFVNVDVRALAPGVVPWDCRTSLPFANGAVSGIRMEHFAEHLDPRDELPALLRDCHRCLAPGGVLRIIVPDAGAYLRAYVDGTDHALAAIGVPVPFPDDLPTRMDVVAFAFHQWHEHRWGYDAESLAARVRAAGFRDVGPTAFGVGRAPQLARDRAEHAPYSLYVEGVR
jgi:predicted SAM-dependent methyltransferase